MTNTVQTIGKPGQDVVFLRGLDARITLVNAQAVRDEEARLMELCDAAIQAHCQGSEDFCRGRHANDVPPLLADVRELRRAWQDGWGAAPELEDMAACSCCIDDTGNPCPHHG